MLPILTLAAGLILRLNRTLQVFVTSMRPCLLLKSRLWLNFPTCPFVEYALPVATINVPGTLGDPKQEFLFLLHLRTPRNLTAVDVVASTESSAVPVLYSAFAKTGLVFTLDLFQSHCEVVTYSISG